ncbi:MAG: hypothetical protein AAF587_00905 [Bacteroidota bacterium]
MKTTQKYFFLAIGLLLSAGTHLHALTLQSFAGTWINERANISKISIEVDEGNASVMVWGLREEGPCRLNSDESFDRVGNNGTELMASIRNGDWEAYMMMRLRGERLEVRVVSMLKEGGQTVTQKYMSSYIRENIEQSASVVSIPGGGIKGIIGGPASATASLFQVLLVDQKDERFLDRQPLNSEEGFYFPGLEDGLYKIKIESFDETGVTVSPSQFDIHIQNGQTISRNIHLE